MAIAIALIVLLLGSILFHFLSPWQLTPLASNWANVDDTINISFIVCGIVFAAVNLFMAYAIIRYRYNKNRRSLYEPENKKLEIWLTGLTTIGVAALLAPGLLVWGEFVTPPEDAHKVEVIGQQWHWSFRYPGKDGRFGAAHARLIKSDNPFGMDPEDPDGQDDILVSSPKMRLPVDRPVKLLLRSKDVLHNFQVAQFRAKMDLVPGQISYVWLTPTREDTFEILCAELCGIGHFAMRGKVEVVAQDEFDEWLAGQSSYAQIAARAPAEAERGKTHYATCVSCHGPEGRGNRELNAPAIAGMDAWYVARQLRNFKQGLRGTDPEDSYGQQMRAMANTLADDAAIANVSAYIQSLPKTIVDDVAYGDPARGERLYRNCSNCHGANGQGIEARNAPPLANLDDWYLMRQLNNFRQGLRGTHADDLYGWQMAEMAKSLVNEQGIQNVTAYISTLTGATQDVSVAARTEED